jgi:hypothetical protein
VADDDVFDAIQRIVAAEVDADPQLDLERGLTVTEWVLIAARQGWNEDGDPVSQVVIVPSDAPEHRLWGLVHEADARFGADALYRHRDDAGD